MNVLETFRLDGRIAVVTGGSGLYGVHLCRALAQAGATVITTSRDRGSAERTAAGLAGEGLTVEGGVLDLADEASITQFHRQVLDRHGRIDVLVNNAVHRQGGGITQTGAADWAATSQVNSLGTFLLTKAVTGSMVAQGSGSVINIGSIYGLVAPDFSIYAGTDMTTPAFYAYDKAGMVGITRYLAAALGPHGVRVNCVAPGGMEGDQPGEFQQAYVQRTPLRRMARGTDICGATVFLASEAAGYVTGAVLPVDGGWTTK